MSEQEAKGRLYLVVEQAIRDGFEESVEKIVEANSQAQAISKVVGTRFTAKAASARDVDRVMAAEYKRGSQ